MTHRILVLGAGYAGLTTTARLARRLHPHDARVTLVNANPHFVERVRLHQLATGQRLADLPLRKLLDGTGVQLIVGRVASVDPERRHVRVTGESRDELSLEYDTLVYALGSMADLDVVPGVAEHAFSVSDTEGAAALHHRAADLGAAGGVLGVVGAGLTGIEAATELAETYPRLRVRLLSTDAPGDGLSLAAQRHLRRVFRRLDIDVRADSPVTEVQQDRLMTTRGDAVPLDATVWTTGFRVPALARESGLAVDHDGRILVDQTMRSHSHPNVYAVGDAALARGPGRLASQQLRMACGTGVPMGWQAADAIAARITGRDPHPFRFRYAAQNISLGRRDGLIQFVRPDDSPHRAILTGRTAARWKEAVVRGSVRVMRYPGLYLAPPRRRELPDHAQGREQEAGPVLRRP
ncbi:NAD(P)/FAD-dependent oxidoreductase [Nocardiopsis gilva]|uniref:NAD(P)/FAD-dependent oxidoreductase n=1 Tax=Nocardiopsis gilva TaxID=280236 RepID=UPI000688B985|nr:FAD-dependent oxidoreductase [Nocardiopsis gilva]